MSHVKLRTSPPQCGTHVGDSLAEKLAWQVALLLLLLLRLKHEDADDTRARVRRASRPERGVVVYAQVVCTKPDDSRRRRRHERRRAGKSQSCEEWYATPPPCERACRLGYGAPYRRSERESRERGCEQVRQRPPPCLCGTVRCTMSTTFPSRSKTFQAATRLTPPPFRAHLSERRRMPPQMFQQHRRALFCPPGACPTAVHVPRRQRQSSAVKWKVCVASNRTFAMLLQAREVPPPLRSRHALHLGWQQGA